MLMQMLLLLMKNISSINVGSSIIKLHYLEVDDQQQKVTYQCVRALVIFTSILGEFGVTFVSCFGLVLQLTRKARNSNVRPFVGCYLSFMAASMFIGPFNVATCSFLVVLSMSFHFLKRA